MQVDMKALDANRRISNADQEQTASLISEYKPPWTAFTERLKGLFVTGIWKWLPTYNKEENFSGDLVSGTTVGIMLIPQVRTTESLIGKRQ